MLKEWNVPVGNKVGLYVLNKCDKTIAFYEFKKKKKFPFAAIPDMYVPEIQGLDQYNLEKWFGGLEVVLARFITKVSKQNSYIFKEHEDLPKLLMSLLSFEFRSPWFFSEGYKYLENNRGLSIEMGHGGKTVHQILCETVVNGTSDLLRDYGTGAVSFAVQSSTHPLIISDCPLIRDQDGSAFIPLTPHLLLSIEVSDRKSEVIYIPEVMTERGVSLINAVMADRSYQWLVSSDLATLERLRDNHVYVEIDRKVEYGKWEAHHKYFQF
jgi:hypothetical protein